MIVPLVTHGAPDPGHPAVVAIVDSAGKTACSGTVVDPHFVLTAAHCVVPQIQHGARVVFGASVASSTQSVPVALLRADPAYDPNSFTADAALVVLGAAAPVALAQLGTQPPSTGSIVTVVGWGETGVDAGDDGTKRVGSAMVSAVAPLSFDVDPDPSQPCVGDSGGAGFAPGSGGGELLVGITSHGDVACATRATFTRVDAVTADFIAPTLAALGPGTAAVGARCYYPEQCKTGGAGACITASDQPGLTYCTTACTSSAACPTGMVCDTNVGGGSCVYGAPTPGAFGGACKVDGDCYDGVCGGGICTVRCVPTDDTCPSGSSCQNLDGGIDFYCVPQPPSSAPAGGCSVDVAPEGGPAGAVALELAALAFIVRARRRTRSPW
ncbi:MAG TPA: trypsin-like serine protease [Polyangiaceae bacterium]|nr:trypsin-like serine protease [Polyangiaceae bacterium]